MQIEDKLLALLKREQQEYAFMGLKQPQQRDAFEYGFRCGIVAGYEQAITLLLKLVDDERNGDRDIERSL